MKPLNHISVLLVAASTLLTSCLLLVSSPLPPSRPHHYVDHESHKGNSNGYDEFYQIPAKGGVFEFQCANDQFNLAVLFDSTTPMVDQHSNGRCGPTVDKNYYKPVKGSFYDGPYYTITCDKDKHKWTIEVKPLTTKYRGSDKRNICVSMQDESDFSTFVLMFEQSLVEYEELDHIH